MSEAPPTVGYAQTASGIQKFAALYAQLDRSNSTLDKVAAMVGYLQVAEPADAAWAVHTLSGNKLKRLASSGELRALCQLATGYPTWLIEDSYSHVGDLAETINLLIDAPAQDREALSLQAWIEERLAELPRLSAELRIATLLGWCRELSAESRFVVLKLLTGSLRVGVSQRLVMQALAQLAQLDVSVIAHRMMGSAEPTAEHYLALLSAERGAERLDQPFPFFLASPLEQAVEALGPSSDWLAEWKWDGIRAQLLFRTGVAQLWSRGEERLDGRFPELERAALTLPQRVVLDGEIVAWAGEAPMPFSALQKRIGRLKPGAKLLEEVPVAFIVYDLLELDGVDCRARSLQERRAALTSLLSKAGPSLRISQEIPGADWPALALERDRARALGVEGLMLKRRSSPYQSGRRRGDWWKWKIEPYTLDAVRIYAQAGHGRRSNLYTDYTFGVWDGDRLVSVAKAYSGLSDPEILTLDRWIRTHTTERFGPVRAVTPTHVFELAFEGINASARHKSGVAVRFPRILRWRTDLAIRDADSVQDLQKMALAPSEAVLDA